MMRPRREAIILSADWEWRHSLARTLEANDIDYAYAATVGACIEIVAAEPVGLIFWDSHLLDSTYQELVQSVQLRDSGVKIVVVSHTDDSDWQVQATKQRAFGVVPFPCEPTDIEWILSRAARAESQEDTPMRVRELQTQF